MANHCIDCEVCGDDLRGSGQQRCTWSGCPGYVIGKKDLDVICKGHPDAELRQKAIEIRKREYPPNDPSSGTPGLTHETNPQRNPALPASRG